MIPIDTFREILETEIIGKPNIEFYPEVSSTNDIAIARAKAGDVREGTLIIADHQTAGRGRYGRTWEAPPGKCILASIVFRHRLKREQVHLPNLIGALSIAQAVHAATGLEARIKHPNDVRIGKKKVAGVLTEIESDKHHRSFFVLGFGVNVNISAAEFLPVLRETATSLRIEAKARSNASENRDIDICRLTLLHAILCQLEEHYLHLKSGKIDIINDQLKTWGE